MIRREEWVFNIFIQHQYPVLTDIYKRHSTISYTQLTREFTRNRGGSKCCLAKLSKINLNINQFIKSTIEVFNCWLFMAMSQSIWESAEGVFNHSTTSFNLCCFFDGCNNQLSAAIKKTHEGNAKWIILKWFCLLKNFIKKKNKEEIFVN